MKSFAERFRPLRPARRLFSRFPFSWRHHLLDTDQTHEWVYAYLGLDAYPITRRDFDPNPRAGPVRSAFQSAFGSEP